MKHLKQLATLVSALALAACATGPDYAPPQRPSAAAGQFIAANGPAIQPLAPVRAIGGGSTTTRCSTG